MKTKKLTWVITAVVGLAVMPAMSHAAFVAGGNTNMSFSTPATAGNFDATLNFAVYRLSGGSYGLGASEAAFKLSAVNGLGSSELDDLPGQEWLYLYQVVNNGPGTVADDPHSVGTVTVNLLDPASVGAWGYFDGYSLKDAEGVVTASNDYGSNSVGTDFVQNAGLTLDGSPGAPGAVATAGLFDPSLVLVSGSSFTAFFDPKVPVGASSSIFGYTSSKGPTFAGAAIINAGQSANGTTLSPTDGEIFVPAPTGVMALASLATLGLGAFYRRRRTVAKS